MVSVDATARRLKNFLTAHTAHRLAVCGVSSSHRVYNYKQRGSHLYYTSTEKDARERRGAHTSPRLDGLEHGRGEEAVAVDLLLLRPQELRHLLPLLHLRGVLGVVSPAHHVRAVVLRVPELVRWE